MLDFLIDNAWTLLVGFITVSVFLAVRTHWNRVKRRADRGSDFEKIANEHQFDYLGNDSEFVELIKNHLSSSALVNLTASSNNAFWKRFEELVPLAVENRRVNLACTNLAHRRLTSGNCFLFDLYRSTVRAPRTGAGSRQGKQKGLFQIVDGDYASYGQGSDTVETRQTVMFGYFEDADFPRLVIRPKSFKQKLMRLIEDEIIELPQNRPLDDMYYCAGKDVPAISQFLSHRLVSAITSRHNFEIESWGNVFVVTLDREKGNSFRMSDEVNDGRIGIDDMAKLDEFIGSSLDLLNVVDESVSARI